MDTALLVSGYIEQRNPDFVGLSVASLRSRYGDSLNIPSGARVTINGVSASEDAIIQPDDEVVFDAPTGTKG